MKSFTHGSGVEVCFPTGWYEQAPRCAHGPMLLFEKFVGGKPEPRKFYSCSACRNRKICDAFIFENDFNRIVKGKYRKDHTFGSARKKLTRVASRYRVSDLLTAKKSNRYFCKDCQLIWLKKDCTNSSYKCKGHNVETAISDYNVLHASRKLLSPLQEDKKNAQYFLSTESTSFIYETLKHLKFTHIICIGMPTLHEEIQAPRRLAKFPENSNPNAIEMKSILLDVDDRYLQFTNPGEFCLFNMFNHHFFDDYLADFKTFVSSTEDKMSKIAVVLDPPFGGLVDAIAETLNWLSQNIFPPGLDAGRDKDHLLSIFWIFPYFLEKRIISTCPSLQMLDYQVNYDNHTKFKKTKTSTRISPIRLYTNIEQSKIVLPESEGYRFCTVCVRYVAQRNVHCLKCGMCPSKDGRTYVHCDKCQACVKPGRSHCNSCERCEIPSHECKKPEAVDIGCHICGKLTHKRRNCPMKEQKRTITEEIPVAKTRASKRSTFNNIVFHTKSSHTKRRKHAFC